MGGNLSHEYHIISKVGEDSIICCTTCGEVLNEEVADPTYPEFLWGGAARIGLTDLALRRYVNEPGNSHPLLQQWICMDKTGKAFVQVISPSKAALQALGLKVLQAPTIATSVLEKAFPDIELDLSKQIDPEKLAHYLPPPSETLTMIRAYDALLLPLAPTPSFSAREDAEVSNKGPGGVTPSHYLTQSMIVDGRHIPVTEISIPGRPRLTRTMTGDACTECEQGRVQVETAIELGHTFHLGTRYSKPLDAIVAINAADPDVTDGQGQNTAKPTKVPMEMGCHGIGVSRLVATIAHVLADAKGLNWPRVVAPFEVVVVSHPKVTPSDEEQVYDQLATRHALDEDPLDVILDDRTKDLSWKLNDADLIGYPVIVVLGRRWIKGDKMCEVQCRQLKVKKEVPLGELNKVIQRLFKKL